jgi:hypothetical protein
MKIDFSVVQSGEIVRRACGLLMLARPLSTRADWHRDDVSLAWRAEGKTVWRLSFDPKKGKPFFDPLSVAGTPSLTNFRPEDHPWHYGLWFSWKYINHANYWEEDRQSGRAEGATRWSPPTISTKPDGRATIKFDLTYTHPSGRVDLSEKRELSIAAPSADGSYHIDWRAHFTAGPHAVVLDRTPMPGEPNGAVNGGYAGLALRLAAAPLGIAFISTAGPITNFVSDRARPAAPAVACNFTDGPTGVGGIAIFSDPVNAGQNAPWYVINNAQFRFACAALLAPQPRALAAGGEFDLRYRIALRRAAWTPAALHAGAANWQRESR